MDGTEGRAFTTWSRDGRGETTPAAILNNSLTNPANDFDADLP